MAESKQEAMGRLERLYAEVSDGELLELASDPESLTEPAQAALEQAMRQRGLQAAVAEEAGDAASLEAPGIPRDVAVALERDPDRTAGMKVLLQTYDGLEMSRACAALEAQQIEPAVEPRQAAAFTGQPDWLVLWVDSAHFERAKRVLRAEMGLFPLREADEVGDEENLAEVVGGEVGDFDSMEEAEEVCRLLLEAGFDASFETGEEADDEGKVWSTVKVEPNRREEALEFLAERFASE